ncbi:AsmA family protein [Flavobacterium agricola]|uniref:AsmA family protein n=1 Tax=Flavobacterium agricola TaxID=2870839 RepID=A0ABY6LVS2_9FLAO|nr:AsmA family protein [Flavobacterium agricola]UYW00425.1 AsmA family protein [Flavobacterium agricola]
MKFIHPKIKKISKIIAITLVSIFAFSLLLVTVIPYFFKDKITDVAENMANEYLDAEVSFNELGVSVFKYFPALIVYVKDVQVNNPKFTESNQVITANTAAVGVNVWGLLQGKFILDAVYLDQADLQLEIDSLGKANFDIIKATESADTTATEFKIKRIIVNKTNIKYNDKSSPLNFNITDLNYKGTGDLSADYFDLNSNVKIKSFDFNADGVDYVRDKPISAEIVTNIDAKELKFTFQKNNIRIKNFPFSFNGYFAFIKGGYDFDLRMQSKNSTLEEMFSLIPPDYDDWRDDMNITGAIDFRLVARGKYMQNQSAKPILLADLQIKNGTMAYKNIKKPLQDIEIDAKALIEDLDINKLEFDLENFSFDLDGKKTQINFHSKGFKKLALKAKVNATIDLERIKETLNLNQNTISGLLQLNLDADGVYLREMGYNERLKKQMLIFKSIPKFNFTANLKNGYLKNIYKEDAIKNVNFDLKLTAKDSLIHNISGIISNINIEAINNYVRGNFELKKLYPFTVNTNLQSKINLADIHKIYPLDSLDVKGKLNVSVNMQGVLNRTQKKYPASKSKIELKDGYIKSLKYPEFPIENISLLTTISSEKGSAADLNVTLEPLEFLFAGSPFKVQGNVHNLNDLFYDIKTSGSLDIGKLTKVLPVKDMQISGIIETNLITKGSKKDLVAQNFSNIKNGGRLVVKNVKINSPMFPETFEIESGTFKFFKDRMRFEAFTATYGKSDVVLNGYIHNFLRFIFNRKYLRDANEQLKAEIDLSSKHIDAKPFLAMLQTYTEDAIEKQEIRTDSVAPVANAKNRQRGPSVFRVPRTANLKITTKVAELEFDAYKINNFDGTLLVKDRKIDVPHAVFQMAGTNIAMQGDYSVQHRLLANYQANFKANNFDIQRAYAEIPIFAQMVTMAKDAHGLVSLDYTLKGAIDQNMDVDFKAIEGEGTLTLEDIKFKNFKILEHVAKKADAEDLEKASFNQIAIHSKIKNNVMTITPVTMKMATFRGKLEGQVTMDGKINVGFRLGLPPFGLINVPMRIVGTADDFEIETGKYKEDVTLMEESEVAKIKAPERRRRPADSTATVVNQPPIDSVKTF